VTDIPPPDSPKPPRGRPRRPKGFDDVPELSDEEVARRVDVRGGGAPRAPIERAPVRDRRPPPVRQERTVARDSLLLIGLVVVGLVAVRLFLPDGPLTATATASPGGSQAAIVTTEPTSASTAAPTGGLITLPPPPPTELGPTPSPAPPTATPKPTPTLKPGQTPKPTPKPTKTPTATPVGTAVLKVTVSVITGDGGTAGPSDWTITVTSAGTATPGSFAGSTVATSVTISAGVTYSVSASGPSGYAKSSSSDCSSGTGGLPVAGQTETCSIVLNDIAPRVTVYTIVDNTGGGTAVPSDVTVTVTGTDVIPSSPFPGSAAGIGVTFDAGTSYTISQSSLGADYTKSSPSAGCSGSGLALGATASCTVTYTYNVQPTPTAPASTLLLPLLALPLRPRTWRSNRAG